jgi:hypothetical protein
MRPSPKVRRENSRGQVLALSCVLMFVVAMTTMLSFNLAQGIHEKMRLQSHSDSIAYSVATVEARSFNYLAYTNRAIAAGLVAQMSLHAWMSTASAAAATLEAGAMAFGMIAALEFIEAGFCPFPCCVAIHCQHAIEAGMVAIKMFMEAMDVADKVKGNDSDFNDAVDDLKTMVDEMHKDQVKVLDAAKGMLTSVPEKLKQVNADTSSLVTEVNGMNSNAFACALEGSSFDGDCTTRAKADPEVRSIVLENSANSARTTMHTALGVSGMDAHEDYRSNSDHLKDLQNNRGQVIVVRMGTAHTGEGYGMTSDNGEKTESVGAFQTASYTVPTWYDVPGLGASMAKIFSDENGGEHWSGFINQDNDHDKFLGAEKDDPCGDENCFVHFRATEDKTADFGQPTIYGAARQDLRTRPGGSKENSRWEVNEQANIKVELVSGQPMEVKLAAREEALAVSKAKAYFHQPGNWKAPPNFFDPFWRAKLHPFKREELVQLLQNVNATADSEMANDLPVEGDTR